MTSTQNQELIIGLKTNCKRGYTKLSQVQAELSLTEQWVITELCGKSQKSQRLHKIKLKRLSRFLRDTDKWIKVLRPTVVLPYTNKRGKTSNKHYNANGKMINGLTGDKSLLTPTWTHFASEWKNMRSVTVADDYYEGVFISLEDQTIYIWEGAPRMPKTNYTADVPNPEILKKAVESVDLTADDSDDDDVPIISLKKKHKKRRIITDSDDDDDKCKTCDVSVDKSNCFIDEWNNKYYELCYECGDDDMLVPADDDDELSTKEHIKLLEELNMGNTNVSLITC